MTSNKTALIQDWMDRYEPNEQFIADKYNEDSWREIYGYDNFNTLVDKNDKLIFA